MQLKRSFLLWLVMLPLPLNAQVTPQIAPLVTAGCVRFDAYTPSGYFKEAFKPEEHRDQIPALVKCISDMTDAVIRTSARGRPASTPETPETPAATSAALMTPPRESPRTLRAAAFTQGGSNSPTPPPTKKPNPPAIPSTLEEQLHTEVVKEYLSYRRLRRWNSAYQASAKVLPEERASLQDVFNDLSETLENAVTEHGISQPFSADLVTAFSLQQAGAQSSTNGGTTGTQSSSTGSTNGGQGTVQQAASNTNAGAAGFVRWQSIHFYADPERRFDVDIAGQFGFEPALALTQQSGGTGTSSAPSGSILATYQPAFMWSVAAEPNARIADLAEITGFFRFGQSVLNTTQSLIENGENSAVVVAAQNNTGRAEGFWEGGVGISIYSQSLEVLHLKKGLLTPMFALSGGLRTDNRFSKDGVLATFDHPEQRMFLRFMIDALQVADKKQPDSAFSIGLSVDFEKARFQHANQPYVPSGTRILVRGDLNLFKASQASTK
jgi:hypothetical protein